MGLIQFLRRNPVKIAHWSEAKSACRIVGRLGQELPQEPKPIKESPKSHIILDTIIGYIMRTILTKNLHQGFTQTRTRMFSRTAFPTADFSEHPRTSHVLCLSLPVPDARLSRSFSACPAGKIGRVCPSQFEIGCV